MADLLDTAQLEALWTEATRPREPAAMTPSAAVARLRAALEESLGDRYPAVAHWLAALEANAAGEIDADAAALTLDDLEQALEAMLLVAP